MGTIGGEIEAVLDLAPDAMVVVDPGGVIVRANAVAAEMFGYPAGGLDGKPADLVVPGFVQQFARGRGNTTKPGQQRGAGGVRLQGLHKSGREIPVKLTFGPLLENGEKKTVVCLRDTTPCVEEQQRLRNTIEDLDRRLKTSELDFRRTNEHFKLFLKHAPAAIALLDRQMRYLTVSDRWLKDFWLGERDIHGLCHYDLFPEVPQQWRDEHRRCLNGEVIIGAEDFVTFANGRTEWMRRELHPWRTGDGRVGGILIFAELITARKNAETALRKSYLELEQRVTERTAELEQMKNDATRANTQKSWFVAAASHDLRQPLQASLAYLSVLSRKAGREDLEDLCDRARQPLKAMSDILDVLLDISELESGHVKPHRCDFPLNELLLRIVSSAQHKAHEKGLRLSCVPTDLTVYSDPRLLERVISNFVINAIRYTDKGLIGIYSEPAGGKVCVSVTDTGIGIPPDSLDTIFEDHVQLGNPARDRRKGLGLGLSIAKRIADALGHRISVQSELGAGSSFSIELPQGQADERQAEPGPADPADSAASGTQPIVLLIDDDQDVAEAMQMLLQSYGFETYMAHSRDAAFAMLQSGLNPGLILCDYRMPGTNGIDLIRQIRQVLQSEIPAVLMTGDMGMTECPADLACCALLHKPVDVEVFLTAIGELAA